MPNLTPSSPSVQPPKRSAFSSSLRRPSTSSNAASSSTPAKAFSSGLAKAPMSPPGKASGLPLISHPSLATPSRIPSSYVPASIHNVSTPNFSTPVPPTSSLPLPAVASTPTPSTPSSGFRSLSLRSFLPFGAGKNSTSGLGISSAEFNFDYGDMSGSGSALNVNPSGSNLTLNNINGAAATVTPSRNPFASFGRRDRKGSVGVDEGKGKGRKMSLNLGNGRPSLNLGRPSMSGNSRTSMSLSNVQRSTSPNGRPSMNFSTEVLSPVIAIGREEEQEAEADVPMRRSVSLSRLEESLSRSDEERGWVGETDAGYPVNSSRRDVSGQRDEEQTVKYDKPLPNDPTIYDEFGMQLGKKNPSAQPHFLPPATQPNLRTPSPGPPLSTGISAERSAFSPPELPPIIPAELSTIIEADNSGVSTNALSKHLPSGSTTPADSRAPSRVPSVAVFTTSTDSSLIAQSSSAPIDPTSTPVPPLGVIALRPSAGGLLSPGMVRARGYATPDRRSQASVASARSSADSTSGYGSGDAQPVSESASPSFFTPKGDKPTLKRPSSSRLHPSGPRGRQGASTSAPTKEKEANREEDASVLDLSTTHLDVQVLHAMRKSSDEWRNSGAAVVVDDEADAGVGDIAFDGDASFADASFVLGAESTFAVRKAQEDDEEDNTPFSLDQLLSPPIKQLSSVPPLAKQTPSKLPTSMLPRFRITTGNSLTSSPIKLSAPPRSPTKSGSSSAPPTRTAFSFPHPSPTRSAYSASPISPGFSPLRTVSAAPQESIEIQADSGLVVPDTVVSNAEDHQDTQDQGNNHNEYGNESEEDEGQDADQDENVTARTFIVHGDDSLLYDPSSPSPSPPASGSQSQSPVPTSTPAPPKHRIFAPSPSTGGFPNTLSPPLSPSRLSSRLGRASPSRPGRTSPSRLGSISPSRLSRAALDNPSRLNLISGDDAPYQRGARTSLDLDTPRPQRLNHLRARKRSMSVQERLLPRSGIEQSHMDVDGPRSPIDLDLNGRSSPVDMDMDDRDQQSPMAGFERRARELGLGPRPGSAASRPGRSGGSVTASTRPGSSMSASARPGSSMSMGRTRSFGRTSRSGYPTNGPSRRAEWLGPRTVKAFRAAGLLDGDSGGSGRGFEDRDGKLDRVRDRDEDGSNGRPRSGSLTSPQMNRFASLRDSLDYAYPMSRSTSEFGSMARSSSEYTPRMTPSDYNARGPLSDSGGMRRRGSESVSAYGHGLMESPTFTTSSRDTGTLSTAPTSLSGSGSGSSFGYVGRTRDRDVTQTQSLHSSHFNQNLNIHSGQNSNHIPNSHLQSELSDLKDKHALETGALLAALSDSQRTVRVLREEIGELRGRLEGAEAEVRKVEGMMHRKEEQDLMRRVEEVDELRAENMELKTENGEMKAETGELKAECEELRAENSELRAETRKLRREMGRLGLSVAVVNGGNTQANGHARINGNGSSPKDEHTDSAPGSATTPRSGASSPTPTSTSTPTPKTTPKKSTTLAYRRRLSTTSSIFPVLPENMTLLLHDRDGESNVDADEHTEIYASSNASSSHTDMSPVKRPNYAVSSQSYAASNTSISPTSANFSTMTGSPESLYRHGSPGSLYLRPEHEMLLGEMESLDLGMHEEIEDGEMEKW